MFLDLDTDVVPTTAVKSVAKRPRPEAKQVTVPAEQWAHWSAICCAMKLGEANTGEIISLPAMEYGGYLHAVFSVTYGGHSGLYQAEAWQMVPESLYAGAAWNYVSGFDFNDSECERERGDYTGMRVSVRGSRMVCVKPVNVIRTLPAVRPISPSEAVFHDEASRQYGWRALHYRDGVVSWKLLDGHPVVVYKRPSDGRQMAVLLWRRDGQIEDYYLGSDFAVADLPAMRVPAYVSFNREDFYAPRVQPLAQPALF